MTLSVIVPCRNEIRYIHGFMRALLSQQVPAGVEWEVLIADGGSTDGTRALLDEYAARHGFLTVIGNPAGIVPTGLNKAIRRARGDVIVRMDVHAEYAADYLAQCLGVLEETGAQNVGGPARTLPGESYMQGAIAVAYHSLFGSGGARFHNVNYEGPVDTVAFGCWRRKTLLDLGLFDEKLVRNQDDELNLRLVRRGGLIWQSPRIACWYKPRATLARLFSQYAQYGYWKPYVIRKHRMPASVRHLVPAAFVGGLLSLAALAPFAAPARGLFAAVLALYALANLAATAAASRNGNLRFAPLLPLVFATLHFSYGLGFLGGILHAARRGTLK
jgi:glycosyltransferase involved in cell wall biosynthesis